MHYGLYELCYLLFCKGLWSRSYRLSLNIIAVSVEFNHNDQFTEFSHRLGTIECGYFVNFSVAGQ